MTSDRQTEAAPQAPTFRQALGYWLRLGFISFGGPAGQIAMMHEELVEKRRWISEKRFMHALNYCMVLPGPEAQQLATYIGWLMHRTWGGIAAGALFVLPSLFMLIALSWVYMAYGNVPAIAAALYGIKPAVTAIVFAAAYRIGSRALKTNALRAIAVVAFLAVWVLDLPFPAIVLAAGLVGWLGGRWAPAQFFGAAGHGAKAQSAHAAVIDDHTPTPPHAVFHWKRLATVVATGLSLWAACLGLLAWQLGWTSTLAQMGWFFTKAALLTFGGAYAVLPYVYQGAVEHYQWLMPTQMLDGLALGETTPGPLIMVVAFVGFVGGWGRQLFGPDSLMLAGAAAACVATLFTFLPSFVFIFMGGPFIESTHGDVKFTAPLTAITAAVVGVILNLAVFLGLHVLWPGGQAAGLDAKAAVIGAAAAVALFRYKTGVISVVLGSALAGFMAKMLL